MSIEQVDADKVLAVLKHVAATAVNEEELRIKASTVLESEVISELGITPGRYEYTFFQQCFGLGGTFFSGLHSQGVAVQRLFTHGLVHAGI